MKTKEEVETLLRTEQAGKKIPQYVCFWADETVTAVDSVSTVHEAELVRSTDEATKILVAYLSPIGVFTPVWELDSEYYLAHSFQFAHTGNGWAANLKEAIAQMIEGNWGWGDARCFISRDPLRD